MDKKKIAALVLLGLAIVIMIMNFKSVDINLLGYMWTTIKSFAILAFVALGVIIGILLK